MARFRNVSDDVRFIPELGVTVTPDDLFDVPDGRADAFAEQPWFTAVVSPAKNKGTE